MNKILLAFLLTGCVTGCAAHHPMASHDGADTPDHIETLSAQAAARIAEAYPPGTTVLHIYADAKNPRFAAALERELRLKGYAFSPAPREGGISLAYQTDRMSDTRSYLRISASDGRDFSLTHTFKE